MLSRISALAPVVAQYARDMEQDRRPKELVSALKSSQIYSMLVPRRYGGLELDSSSAVRAISALAKLERAFGAHGPTRTIQTRYFCASVGVVERALVERAPRTFSTRFP